MSLSATMEIGRNGLRIYQVANEVTAENIANVNTPGYSRQKVVLENAPPQQLMVSRWALEYRLRA